MRKNVSLGYNEFEKFTKPLTNMILWRNQWRTVGWKGGGKGGGGGGGVSCPVTSLKNSTWMPDVMLFFQWPDLAFETSELYQQCFSIQNTEAPRVYPLGLETRHVIQWVPISITVEKWVKLSVPVPRSAETPQQLASHGISGTVSGTAATGMETELAVVPVVIGTWTVIEALLLLRTMDQTQPQPFRNRQDYVIQKAMLPTHIWMH